MASCFPLQCTCSCSDVLDRFDSVVASETQFAVTLKYICHSNIGWFTDRSLGDDAWSAWGMAKERGIYVLWHKNDYCADHELFHMSALYIGKGAIPFRLRSHWQFKSFAEQQLVYWTYVELPNRQAKYVEQLLLDTYSIPFNVSENPGTHRLCAYFSQSEVD
jgi:hypothetical protein